MFTYKLSKQKNTDAVTSPADKTELFSSKLNKLLISTNLFPIYGDEFKSDLLYQTLSYTC